MWGKSFYSSNFNDLLNAKRMGMKVVVIDEENTREFKSMGCVVLSVLLPPFESINAELNGNAGAAKEIYINYLLNSEICKEAFATICTALFTGNDILFYVGADQDKNLTYGNTIMEFMFDMFGIPMGTIQYPPSGVLNDKNGALENRISIMFNKNLISFDTFCIQFPYNMYPSIESCYIILQLFGINPMHFNDKQSAIEFCRRVMNNNIIDLANKSNNKDSNMLSIMSFGNAGEEK